MCNVYNYNKEDEKKIREKERERNSFMDTYYCNKYCNFDTLREEEELWLWPILEYESQTEHCTKICYNGKICNGENAGKYEFCGKIERYLKKTGQFDSLVIR